VHLDLSLDPQIPAIGMTQKDKPHNREKIFIAGELAVAAELVRCVPEAPFNSFNIVHGKC
jgi:hypothetical protein